MIEREQWEWDLTNAISKAREADLSEVVLAIQNSIWQIHLLKTKAQQLDTLKEILGK